MTAPRPFTPEALAERNMENDPMTDEQRETLIAAERVMRELMVGCHFTIDLWPVGGQVGADGCDECGGTSRTYGRAIWVSSRGGRTEWLPDAINEALAKLRDATPEAPDEDE